MDVFSWTQNVVVDDQLDLLFHYFIHLFFRELLEGLSWAEPSSCTTTIFTVLIHYSDRVRTVKLFTAREIRCLLRESDLLTLSVVWTLEGSNDCLLYWTLLMTARARQRLLSPLR